MNDYTGHDADTSALKRVMNATNKAHDHLLNERIRLTDDERRHMIGFSGQPLPGDFRLTLDTAWENAEDGGWHEDFPDTPDTAEQNHWILAKLMLTTTEISEAVEHIRNGHSPADTWVDETGKPDGFPVEIADVIIRLFDLYGTLENNGSYAMPDLHQTILNKLDRNKARGHRHGGKTV